MTETPKPRMVLASFAAQCELKLRKNDHKTDWKDLPIEALFRKLKIEIEELEVAIKYEGAQESASECVDIANFAMMLWDRILWTPENTRVVQTPAEEEFITCGQWMQENALISNMYRRRHDPSGPVYYDNCPEARNRRLNILPAGAKVV